MRGGRTTRTTSTARRSARRPRRHSAPSSSPAQRSKAATLQGVLTFDEATADPINGPALIRRALGDFERAVKIDPTNEEAKYNLEFLLRVLDPSAARLRIRENIPAYRPGRSAPGGAPPRRGRGY